MTKGCAKANIPATSLFYFRQEKAEQANRAQQSTSDPPPQVKARFAYENESFHSMHSKHSRDSADLDSLDSAATA